MKSDIFCWYQTDIIISSGQPDKNQDKYDLLYLQPILRSFIQVGSFTHSLTPSLQRTWRETWTLTWSSWSSRTRPSSSSEWGTTSSGALLTPGSPGGGRPPPTWWPSWTPTSKCTRCGEQSFISSRLLSSWLYPVGEEITGVVTDDVLTQLRACN